MKTPQHVPQQRVLSASRRFALALAVALGLGATASAQLTVTNGDFDNYTGLTATGNGWYGGPAGSVPFGWTGSSANNSYLVYSGICNLAQWGAGGLSQMVGTTTNDTAVVLRFDNNKILNAAGGTINAVILDASNNVLATNQFGPGSLGAALVAPNVPSNTAIVIKLIRSGVNSGLTHVSVLTMATNAPPVITQQPMPYTALPSVASSATIMNLQAYGIPPLSYQWRSNGVALSLQTNKTLTVTGPGSYTAVLTDGNGLSVTSAVAQVVATNVMPVLNGDFSQRKRPGANPAWMTLDAPNNLSGWNGSGHTYALNNDANSNLGGWAVAHTAYNPWYDFQVNASGPFTAVVAFRARATSGTPAETARLVVGTTTNSQAVTINTTPGSYMVAFTNTVGSGNMLLNFSGVGGSYLASVSAVAFVGATDAPIITMQPTASQLLLPGQNLNLAVQALGIPPLSYQWRTNGVALGGQTAPTLSISGVGPSDAGSYTVVVTGGNGMSATSTVAQVNIPSTPPITILSDPLNGTGSLNGTIPSSRGGIGNQPWAAGTNMVMDGTTLTLANAIDAAFLPFTPDSGNIYTLSCEMNITASTSDFSWVGMGFSESAEVADAPYYGLDAGTPYAWMAQVGNGNFYLFRGPGAGNSAGAALPIGPGYNYVHTNTVVLNTAAAQWTVEWLVDGVSKAGPLPITTGNPVLGYIDLGTCGTNSTSDVLSGTYANLKVTAVLPRIIPSLSLQTSGSDATLSWDIAAGGWALESSASLSSPSWTVVPGVVNNSVTVPIGTGSLFFRLRSAY